MNRRRFVLASGAGFLGSSITSQIQQPAVGIDFELSSDVSFNPSGVESLVIHFSQFEITPYYLNSNNNTANITVTADIVGDKTEEKSVRENLVNGVTVTKDELGGLSSIQLNDLTVENSVLEGSVKITVDHPDVSESYRQPFLIESNPDDIVTDGLISYWSLDDAVSGTGGTVTDSAGSNNGSTVNGVNTGVSGVVDSAFKFDGSNFVRVQNSSNLNPEEITVSAWAKYDSLQDQQGAIVRKNQAYVLYADNSDRGMQYYNWNTNTRVNTNVKPTIGEWEHWVATNNGSRIKVYKDTTPVADVEDSTNGSSNDNLGIGAQATEDDGAGLFPMSGSVDDVRIYNRALDDKEIEKLYNIGI